MAKKKATKKKAHRKVTDGLGVLVGTAAAVGFGLYAAERYKDGKKVFTTTY